jgi:hypothetical protein
MTPKKANKQRKVVRTPGYSNRDYSNREANAVAIVRPARTLTVSPLRLLQSVPLLVGADQQRHRDCNIENTCDPFQRR